MKKQNIYLNNIERKNMYKEFIQININFSSPVVSVLS
jgi:hypothetical protein